MHGESTLKVFSTELQFISPNQGNVFPNFMIHITNVRGHVIPVWTAGHRPQSARVTFGKTVSLPVKKESQGVTSFLSPILLHGMLMLYLDYSSHLETSREAKGHREIQLSHVRSVNSNYLVLPFLVCKKVKLC